MIRDAKSRGDRFDERVALGPLLRSFLKYERNVAATAPYFHDGSAATLNEAVRQMGLSPARPRLDRLAGRLHRCVSRHAHRNLPGPIGHAGEHIVARPVELYAQQRDDGL